MNAKREATGAWDRERVVELLLEAGRRAVALRKGIRLHLKPDSSVVTEADRDIEALFAGEFDRPEAGAFLIGEETVAGKGEEYIERALRGTAWVVDPIDGTSPYCHHLPNWGISIGRMQGGKLTDGAVLLPDYRLLVASDGPRVLAAEREEGSATWEWREVSAPPVEQGPSGIVAITQDVAKSGRVAVPNPVMAVGAAVVPLVGLLVGRFLAYLGSLRLWDLAGSLPLLHRLHFSVTRLRDPSASPLGLEVGPESYFLDPGDRFRWGVRGGILACATTESAWIRKAFGASSPS